MMAFRTIRELLLGLLVGFIITVGLFTSSRSLWLLVPVCILISGGLLWLAQSRRLHIAYWAFGAMIGALGYIAFVYWLSSRLDSLP